MRYVQLCSFKYGNYIFRSFPGNVCCKAVKFRMKLSCSGYVQHDYLHIYIARGIYCGNWNTFLGKFSVRVLCITITSMIAWENSLHFSQSKRLDWEKPLSMGSVLMKIVYLLQYITCSSKSSSLMTENFFNNLSDFMRNIQGVSITKDTSTSDIRISTFNRYNL